MDLYPSLYVLKTEAFEEEREWRLLSNLSGVSLRFAQYRPTRTQLIPYRSFDLDPIDGKRPILKVWLGPKHTTPSDIVEHFLEKSSFPDVEIERSKASYR